MTPTPTPTLVPRTELPNTGGWKDRHIAAINAPRTVTGEWALLKLITAWRDYAKMHKAKYEAPIGDDGYVGEYWQDIGHALVKLLSADHGQRLDNGTLDVYLRAIAAEHGVDGNAL
jgi:hypothetical protein